MALAVGSAGGKGDSDGNGKHSMRSRSRQGPRRKRRTQGTEKKDKDIKIEAPPEQTLKIEVLGNDSVKKLTKSGPVDLNKRYRIVGEPTLYTLEEVRKLILERRKGSPPLRQLVVVVYRDSPDSRKSQVTDLVEWVRNELDPKRGEITVDLQQPKA